MANQAIFGETEFSVGDTISVHHKFKETDKERVQAFTGIVIAIRGHEPNKSFTVRKIASGGIGVERIWPLLSPSINKIVVKKKGKVRRAKLYYLRQKLRSKALKIKERRSKSKPKKATKDEQAKTAQKATKAKLVGGQKKTARKTRRKASQKTSS